MDGVDVKDWKQADLRNRVAYVPQKATLFSGTISSNIDYGEGPKEIAPEDIVEAARVSASAEFIAEKEDGYASQGGAGRCELLRRPETAPLYCPRGGARCPRS